MGLYLVTTQLAAEDLVDGLSAAGLMLAGPLAKKGEFFEVELDDDHGFAASTALMLQVEGVDDVLPVPDAGV